METKLIEEILSSRKVDMFTTSLLIYKITISLKIKQKKCLNQTINEWTLGNSFYSFRLEMISRQNDCLQNLLLIF